jgi:hypothetical protein
VLPFPGGAPELAADHDDNGQQTARWRVTIAPGEHFVNRTWMVDKMYEREHS